MTTTTKPKALLRAPFPWFGGKALAADLVWERFGLDVKNYIEPFFGSGAILLNAPEGTSFKSAVNDIDAHVANFWRSISADPDSVAHYASSQVNEVDLQARHQYLVDNAGMLAERLKSDPDSYDARLAGWWAWGCSCWIGSGWCAPRERVSRQIPHLVNAGQGVNRKCDDREIFLSEWFDRLNSKFKDTRVTCGDWRRVCTVSIMTYRRTTCAVLLDPPYGTTGAVYAHDSMTVVDEVKAWCLENGSNPKLRIALCGHVGQHEDLEDLGWSVVSPRKAQGYQGADNRERIWFSPACLSVDPQQGSLFNLN